MDGGGTYLSSCCTVPYCTVEKDTVHDSLDHVHWIVPRAPSRPKFRKGFLNHISYHFLCTVDLLHTVRQTGKCEASELISLMNSTEAYFELLTAQESNLVDIAVG
jgi:hypothetical protein